MQRPPETAHQPIDAEPLLARILVFAYAREPDKGGEPEAGWVWARMLAKLADVTVLTRERMKATVLKTVSGATRSRVRIPVLPRS